MDSQRREADTVPVDEVARQRQKHSVACRDQLVSGNATVTIGELADRAAAAGMGTDIDAVTRLLLCDGHSPSTIEKVIRCLGLDGTIEPAQDGTVQPIIPASPGQHRLRTVAQLEALLLED